MSAYSFRKLPVVIEAVRINAADWNGDSFDGCPFDFRGGEKLPKWLVDAVEDSVVRPDTPNCTDYAEWRITTLEGVMTASPDDWLICGVKGEIYPCKADIFAATYEPIEAAVMIRPPALAALPGKHLGWEIDRDFLGHWRAVHPSFDGESDTVQLTALTRRDLIAEIDLWIEENEVRS